MAAAASSTSKKPTLERAATADYVKFVRMKANAIDEAITRLAKRWIAFYVRLQDTVLKPEAIRHPFPSFLLPSGTFAAGVWQPGDDVHVLWLWNPQHGRARHEILKASFSKQLVTLDDNSSGTNVNHIPWTDLIPQSKLRPESGKFILSIAQLPATFDLEQLTTYGNLSYSEKDSFCEAEARTLSCVRHVWQLNLRILEKGLDEPRLRFGYIKVHRWAKAMGLIAPNLDLCSSYRLYELYVGAAEGCLQYATDNGIDADMSFFRVFCTRGEVLLTQLVGEQPGDLAAGWSVPAIRALADALKGTRENYLADPYIDRTIFTKDFGASMFLNHAAYIAGTFEFWDMDAAEFDGWRSTTPEILRRGIEVTVDPLLRPRIWPYPQNTSTSITYFVGITRLPDSITVDLLSRVVQDPKWRFAYSLLSREEVAGGLGIDPHLRGALITLHREQNGLSKEMDATAEEQIQPISPGDDGSAHSDEVTTEITEDQPHQGRQEAKTNNPPEKHLAGPKTRLRTAQSAIARLKTDPMHQSVLYEVGYRDRFLEDLQWLPLELWAKATEDEDFIPLSRVYQLRRCDNEVVVWDRAARIDKTGVEPGTLSPDG